MKTLWIKVKPDAEEVLTNSLLHRGTDFNLESEDWDNEEFGLLEVLLDADDTTASVEQGLNTNDDVLSWWLE